MYMYQKKWQSRSQGDVENIILENPFATVITNENGKPFANHFPLVFEKSGNRNILRGHMFHKNTQLKHITEAQQVLCVFHGPHCYVSPKLDPSPTALPTWNYIVIHVYGQGRVIQDQKWLMETLRLTGEFFEKGQTKAWQFPEVSKEIDQLSKMITGFEIEIERIESQFKLNQDRSSERKEQIQNELAKSQNQSELKISEWMKKYEC